MSQNNGDVQVYSKLSVTDKLTKHIPKIIDSINTLVKKTTSVMTRVDNDIVVETENDDQSKTCTTYICGLNRKNALILEIVFDNGNSVIQEECYIYNTINSYFDTNFSKNAITRAFSDSGFTVSLVENNTVKGPGYVCQIDVADFTIDISIAGCTNTGTRSELSGLVCKFKMGNGGDWETVTGLSNLINKLGDIRSCFDTYSRSSKLASKKTIPKQISPITHQCVSLPITPNKSSQIVPEPYNPPSRAGVPSSSNPISSNSNGSGMGFRLNPTSTLSSNNSQSSKTSQQSSQSSQSSDLEDSFADSDDIDALYGRLSSEDKICVRDMWGSTFSDFKAKYANRPTLMKFIATFQGFGEDCFRGFMKEWGVRQ